MRFLLINLLNALVIALLGVTNIMLAQYRGLLLFYFAQGMLSLLQQSCRLSCKALSSAITIIMLPSKIKASSIKSILLPIPVAITTSTRSCCYITTLRPSFYLLQYSISSYLASCQNSTLKSTIARVNQRQSACFFYCAIIFAQTLEYIQLYFQVEANLSTQYQLLTL